VWIKINCEVTPLETVDDVGYLRVNHWLFLSTGDWLLPSEEILYLTKGIELVENALKPKMTRLPVLLRITQLEYVLTDYQVEGLAFAIAGWLDQQFHLEWRAPEVSFDGVRNRYLFPI
jgi:hypothetical protein